MDRLHPLGALALLALALLATACEDGGPPAAAPSRVIAVAADPNAGPNLDEFCDAAESGADAPEMAFPALTGPAPSSASGMRWVNVWATWCAPCVEEIPRLLRFRDRLAEDGAPVELLFVSADGDDEAVTTFRDAHPDTPAGPRIADPTSLPAWATSIGLDSGATLPIHLFVDADDRVRCARTGGIDEEHFDAVAAIVSP